MTEPFYTFFYLISERHTCVSLIESTFLYTLKNYGIHILYYVNEALFQATTIVRIDPFVLCLYSFTIRIPLLIFG